MVYNWTTYPLTCLLEHVWKTGVRALSEERHLEPTLVELCSCLERALNFMHTGNTAVIASSVMNPLWIGLAIIHDGHPCLNSRIIPTLTGSTLVNNAEWPYNKRQEPRSGSKGSQVRQYGRVISRCVCLISLIPAPTDVVPMTLTLQYLEKATYMMIE